MDVYIVATAYYATLVIGVCGLIVAASYLLDKAFTAILSHYRVYDEFVRYVYDKRRKKRTMVTPKINPKEDD